MSIDFLPNIFNSVNMFPWNNPLKDVVGKLSPVSERSVKEKGHAI